MVGSVLARYREGLGEEQGFGHHWAAFRLLLPPSARLGLGAGTLPGAAGHRCLSGAQGAGGRGDRQDDARHDVFTRIFNDFQGFFHDFS